MSAIEESRELVLEISRPTTSVQIKKLKIIRKLTKTLTLNEHVYSQFVYT